MKLWHIIVVVLAGVAFGLLEPGRFEYALGHATLYVFLPPLLFEAAWNLNYRAMKRQWRAIAVLVGPGVILTALIVAGALSAVRVPLAAALLTGAVLSATDPIAVIAVFKRLKVPRTLATIVECESLFNDAVAVVLYRGVLLVLATGLSGGAIAFATAQAVLGSIAGIALGIGIAYAFAHLLRTARGNGIQLVATTVCAYGSYFVAEELHLSGIFAVISCGIALRYFERRWIALSIAEDVNRFWDLAALFANIVVFFMVGAALQVGYLTRNTAFIIATLIGVALARVVVSGLLLPARFPREWLDVIRIAGLRSALSLALALALPVNVPYRDAIVGATFAVVIATLAVSGLTMTSVVARTTRVRGTEASS